MLDLPLIRKSVVKAFRCVVDDVINPTDEIVVAMVVGRFSARQILLSSRLLAPLRLS